MKIKPIFILALAAAVTVTAAIGILLPCKNTALAVTAACGIETGGASIDNVNIYNTALSKNRLDSLEDYIVGVVAAEMPASYGDEALKAQAVAARTYALRALEANPSLSYSDIGQAYISRETMISRWGDSYDGFYGKIKNAVISTRGIIAVYNSKPILAAFCASSGGITEESQNVWGQSVPYLISVDSHWDSDSKDFTQTLTFTQSEITDLLGGIPEIQSRSQAGYVQTVYAGGEKLTGIQVRQLLGLKSADFQVSQSDNKIYITTKGYGHGVGMSQVGAAGMAKDGKAFNEILSHYYPGTELAKVK